jgi:hypothetical protein
VRNINEVFLKRYQLDAENFFSSPYDGNEWEATRLLKAPPLNKTRDWKSPPRFKAVLTLLRSSAEAGVTPKVTPKWSAPQKEVLSVRNDKISRGSGFNCN